MRDVIDRLTPGRIDAGNVANFAVAALVVYFYTQGHFGPETALMIIGAVLGVDTAYKSRKPKLKAD